MKRFRKIPIILTLAGLTLFIACNNDDDEPEKVQKHNVEIILNGADSWGGVSEALKPSIMKEYNDDASVDTVIIYAQGDWSWLRGPNQDGIIKTLKAVRSRYSKTWGRGDFNFYPGDLSEEDSLFFINNGWTVNKDLQK
ncbi:MAG: hypothetical protein IJ213_06315 [Bacteroidales bacterium]|nr:hypothetical protein [Bacteroidales bacterium]MBQ9312644.1 hypothetical protein [Bacteroidales bacterium]